MTTARLVATACVAAAATAVLVPWPASARLGRLATRRPGEANLPVAVPPGAAAPSGTAGKRWQRSVPALCGVAAAVLVGGWVGTVLGVLAATAAWYAVRRLEPADVRAERAASAADLPLAMDLMAAALRAGSPVDAATDGVAEALAGPLGLRLSRVARSLRLGAEPAEAWDGLSDVPGARRVTAAAVRSASRGGALADALGRIADDLRADRAVAAEAAARRAGVLVVLPLGLCFLPAFVLAGLAPVIIAVLGGVL